MIGCSARLATARVATLDDGHTSSGMPVSARWASRAGSWADEVPWPIRSAPSRRSDSHTVSGPVVSPACGTECSPAARAASNTGWNWARGTPISGPPSPKPTRPSGRWSTAYASVASADGSPNSPGMS